MSDKHEIRKKRYENIQMSKAMHRNVLDRYARKFFGKPYHELDSHDKIDVKDLVEQDNE